MDIHHRGMGEEERLREIERHAKALAEAWKRIRHMTQDGRVPGPART